MKLARIVTLQALGLVLLAGLQPVASLAQQCYPGLPNPILSVTGHKFTIENREAFPEELFDRAPNLAPCGANTNSSRTWVDLIDQDGNRFYGYCSLSSPTVLKNFGFPDRPMLTALTVVLRDRACGMEYRSNTVPVEPVPEPAEITTVSAAGYQPAVSPGSLAALFAENFSDETTVAMLDDHGALPTELAGLTVEFDGRPASLIVVSPSQINCVVPGEVPLGEVEVTVKSADDEVIAIGMVTVLPSAPALFSLDASGSGPGAILNAVTGDLGPFSVSTPENPGGDMRTRLAIYATGVRFAGSLPPVVDPLAAAANVRVIFRDSEGMEWSLPVEYAGPAPGYFGLDQLNVVVPQELEGSGPGTIQIETELGVSNAVDCHLE